MDATFAVAVGIGLAHTVLGPDHYLPFLVIGRARRWNLPRTLALTVACGLGHVGSSVLLGLLGALLGAGLGEVQELEAYRGALAGWSLLIFGLAYGAWGLFHARHHDRHGHAHLHGDGTVHVHPHEHPAHDDGTPHSHPHAAANPPPRDAEARPWRSLTPWVLFLVFVLGPCEPLIPLFFADAMAGEWGRAAGTAAGYALATLAAMTAIVAMAWTGLFRLRLGGLERFSHAVAGGIVALAGFSMVFLGL